MNFSMRFSTFSSDKMTFYNDNDQTWFSDTQTSARHLGGYLHTTVWVQQMLMHRNMFDIYYSHTTYMLYILCLYIDSRGGRAGDVR